MATTQKMPKGFVPDSGDALPPGFVPDTGTATEAPPPPTSDSSHYAKMFLQGAGNLLGGIGASVFEPVATGQRLLTGRVSPYLQELATPPEGAMGKVGFYGGEAGQFMAPAEAEEKAGTFLAEHAPRGLKTLSSIVPQALAASAVNKLQGGTFTGGAEAGAAGGVAGKIGEKLAPAIAESAMGITNRMRAFGKTPGKAIIEETSGYSPAKIEESAKGAMNRIGSQLASVYQQAGQSGGTVSLQPALEILQNEWLQARKMRNPEAIKAIEDLAKRLTTSYSGTENSVQMTPEELWNVKRGLGMDTNWNPNIDTKWLQGIRRKVYGAIDGELDRAVPEAASLNQRYSSLKPVARRANIESRGASVPQRVMESLQRPTGVFARMGAGGYLGYREGGKGGVIPGAVLGFVGPEMLGSRGQMFVARNAATIGSATPKISLPLLRQIELRREKR